LWKHAASWSKTQTTEKQRHQQVKLDDRAAANVLESADGSGERASSGSSVTGGDRRARTANVTQATGLVT
jgi:hypothetical protein